MIEVEAQHRRGNLLRGLSDPQVGNLVEDLSFKADLFILFP